MEITSSLGFVGLEMLSADNYAPDDVGQDAALNLARGGMDSWGFPRAYGTILVRFLFLLGVLAYSLCMRSMYATRELSKWNHLLRHLFG